MQSYKIGVFRCETLEKKQQFIYNIFEDDHDKRRQGILKKLIQKSVAFLSCLLLLGRTLPPVWAAGTEQPVADSLPLSSEAQQDISLTVSIFENVGRGWILNPVQLQCPAGSGLEELLELLDRYAYLDTAEVSNGKLLSLTDDHGKIYDGGPDSEDEWLMLLNGIEHTSLRYMYDQDGGMVDFAFQDGDTLQLVFSSTDTENSDVQTVSTPSHNLSTTDEELPWDAGYDDAMRAGCGWLKTNSESPLALTVFGAIGDTVDYKYLTRILRNIHQQQSPSGIELSENILCVSFSGISAENFSGQNLLQQLITFPDLDRVGTVYGLLAYDCNSYDVPSDALNSRDAMLNVIMAGQNPDGGIANIQGEDSDVFLTALSLTALAPYRNDETIGACIDRALQWLSEQQNSDGFFYSGRNESCLATSAVILALSSLSISLTDERFCNNGHHLMDMVMEFNVENSGFAEQLGESPSAEATELALLAICSQKTGRNPLILRSPVTGSGSIDFSESSEPVVESSAPSSPQNDTRSQIHVGLISAISGVSVGIALMLAVLLHLKNKYKQD